MTQPIRTRCARCGRPLLDPQSRRAGYGSVCAQLAMAERRTAPRPRAERQGRNEP